MDFDTFLFLDLHKRVLLWGRIKSHTCFEADLEPKKLHCFKSYKYVSLLHYSSFVSKLFDRTLLIKLHSRSSAIAMIS